MKKKRLLVQLLLAVSFVGLTSCGESIPGATGPQGEKGEQGVQGEPGVDGISIISVVKTMTTGLTDVYTITYSDGTTNVFTVTNGEQGIQGIQGAKGEDGHTPVITVGENGNWYIDGVDTTKPVNIKGDTGNGISNIEKTNREGLVDTYTITFTNGTTTTFTVTNGEQGIQGIQGVQGESGHTPVITVGENGNWYIDGVDTTKPVNIKGDTGNGISSITKTGSEGLIDTYTITFTNGTTTTFTVTNGEAGHSPVFTVGENGNWYIDGVDTTKPVNVKGDTGNGISSIAKTGSEGLVDTYTVTYTDGTTFTYTVANGATGNGISSITKTGSEGLVDTYTITYTDGTSTTFTVTNGTQGIQGIQGVQGESGHTPVITVGENGNWYIDGVDTTKPVNIKGDTGNGISSIAKTGSEGLIDTYTITFTNGSTTTFTVTNGTQGIQGIQGVQGESGHTPVITVGENGNWYIDGVDTTKPVNIKGDTGNGISSITKTGSEGLVDTYTITFTNGTTTTFTITNGDAGGNGESSYEIFVKYHPEYTGTEEEWINDVAMGKKCNLFGHSYSSVITAPTCTANGYTTHTCTVCGNVLVDTPVVTEGHQYATTTVLPTNVTQGFDQHVCSVCGDTYKDNYVDPLSHLHSYTAGICSVCGEHVPTEGISYVLDSDGISYYVSGKGTCTKTDVILASVYNGLPVKRIADGAFNGAALSSIMIPSTITTIGSDAFKNCTALEKTIYEGDIHGWVTMSFANEDANPGKYSHNLYFFDTLVETVNIPSDVTELKDYTFFGIHSIQSATLSEGLTSIGTCTFYNCEGLTSLDLPDGFIYLGKSSIANCTNLATMRVPSSMQKFDLRASDGCSNLSIIYYQGTAEQWNSINFSSYTTEIQNARRYYYSETKPTVDGRFWYYENGYASIWMTETTINDWYTDQGLSSVYTNTFDTSESIGVISSSITDAGIYQYTNDASCTTVVENSKLKIVDESETNYVRTLVYSGNSYATGVLKIRMNVTFTGTPSSGYTPILLTNEYEEEYCSIRITNTSYTFNSVEIMPKDIGVSHIFEFTIDFDSDTIDLCVDGRKNFQMNAVVPHHTYLKLQSKGNGTHSLEIEDILMGHKLNYDLDGYKSFYKEKLTDAYNSYDLENYYTAQQTELSTILSTGKTDISSSTDIETARIVMNTAVKQMAVVSTKSKIDLANAKSEGNAYISDYRDNELPLATEEQQVDLNAAINKAFAAIAAMENASELDEIKSTFDQEVADALATKHEVTYIYLDASGATLSIENKVERVVDGKKAKGITPNGYRVLGYYTAYTSEEENTAYVLTTSVTGDLTLYCVVEEILSQTITMNMLETAVGTNVSSDSGTVGKILGGTYTITENVQYIANDLKGKIASASISYLDCYGDEKTSTKKLNMGGKTTELGNYFKIDLASYIGKTIHVTVVGNSSNEGRKVVLATTPVDYTAISDSILKSETISAGVVTTLSYDITVTSENYQFYVGATANIDIVAITLSEVIE